MAPKKTPAHTPSDTPAKKPDARKQNEPPKHTRWKKGQSGNPLGGAAISPETRALRNLTKAELVDVGNLVIKGDFDTLKALARAPKATVLQRMLASVAVKIIDKGDMHSLDILLNRMVGRVKEEVTLTSNVPQVVVNLPANGREAKEDEPRTTVSGL